MQGLLVIMMALIAGQVTGHPHGAPTTACNTMFPLHKHHPQTSACPFETRPYQTEIFSNSSVRIALHNLGMLSGSSSGSSSSSENTTDSFKGYMIMAFEVPSENAVALGTFQVSSDSHTINCHGMQQNAATHSSKSHKSIVHLTWTPPEDFEGDVIFKTTYVASKKLFWMNQVSAPVRVRLAAAVADEESDTDDDNTVLIQNDVLEGKLIEQVAYLESREYISLWAICSLFIVGFTCAVLAKLILAARAKKYSTLESI
ncbi:putative defense protein Hdd11-like [Daphnia pulex]|uniref:putative defense protein Hdd11-like n=1 Tax=Daphnia pulex TaxID=6669 RepID=UPI001EDDD812|nr:putative defense protein Hdd11-like [Daphnia pulex]